MASTTQKARWQQHEGRSTTVTSILGTSLSDLLFFAAYVTWLVLMILNTSLFSKYFANGTYAGVRITCLLLLVLKELIDLRITQTSFAGFLVAIVMAGCGLVAVDTVLVDGIAFIVCGRNKDFRTIARISVRVASATVLFVILCSLIGLVPNYSIWSGGRQRSYLGFRYTLYPSSYLFFITCLQTYLYKERITLPHALALAACNAALYIVTTSRISFFLSLAVIIASFALAHTGLKQAEPAPETHKFTAVACSSVYFVAAIVSFLFATLFSSTNPIMRAIDNVDVLGGRMGISHNAIHTYGLHLFGREMHFSGAALSANGSRPIHEAYDYIDNFFVKVAINYGLVFLFLFLLCETKVLRNAYLQRDYFLVIPLIAIAIHCLVDNAAINLYYNPFLFLMGGLITTGRKNSGTARTSV